MRSYKNDLFLRAARGERTPRPPIWLMRQAGRTDPAYNALRDRTKLALEDLFRHAELAAEVSLLPLRLGIDAIIYFQDILTPLGPMGCPFVFRPGPQTEQPVRTAADIASLQYYDVASELPFIGETFRLIRSELDDAMPVLGFAGAPFTLLTFMAEGRSFGTAAPNAQKLLGEAPETAHVLLRKLTKLTIDYLQYQMESGADAVQLFESAANVINRRDYREFALPYQQEVLDALRGAAPTIVFARGWEHVEDLGESGADILSIHSHVSIAGARRVCGPDRIIQGNLNNELLLSGTLDEIEDAALACIESGERRGHIFNLDHGLLRETPYENIQHLTRVVRNAATTS